MKQLSTLRWLMWMVGVAMLTACTKDDTRLFDAKPKFDVILDGQSILGASTPQTLELGKSTRFDMIYSNIAYLDAITPNGWKCALIVSEKYLTINAPSYTDVESDLSGVITFKAYDASGNSVDYTLPVEAFEGDMGVTVNEDISQQQIFGFGKTKTYSYSLSQNAEKLDIVVPDGWSYQIDQRVFSITAPDAAASTFANEGTVVVTALSPRGNKGEAVRIGVAISRAVPTITFEHETYSFNYDQRIEIPFTSAEVVSAVLKNIPAGWTAEINTAASKLIVKAPAKNAGAIRGVLDIVLTS